MLDNPNKATALYVCVEAINSKATEQDVVPFTP